ncbi:hypothetical protein KFE98_03975 [bacterium SCSIO 12741]|nr:hypothetical protein KFE98_03975 [bacterium SCSIO 12741]
MVFRIILISVFFLGSVLSSFGQNGIEAGIRIGNSPGRSPGVGIDGTMGLSAHTRMHPSFYWLNNGIGVGLYLDRLFDFGKRFRLYPGIGPEFYFDQNFEMGIAANMGFEYAFEFPITFGFDYRPSFTFVNRTDLYTENWGFTLRYRLKD